MFTCPHCSKTIDFDVTTRQDVAWWRYDPGPTRASLGCGTLIIIAIIVSMFSRSGDGDIRALRTDIQALERKIDNLQARPVAAPVAAPVNPGQNDQ